MPKRVVEGLVNFPRISSFAFNPSLQLQLCVSASRSTDSLAFLLPFSFSFPRYESVQSSESSCFLCLLLTLSFFVLIKYYKNLIPSIKLSVLYCCLSLRLSSIISSIVLLKKIQKFLLLVGTHWKLTMWWPMVSHSIVVYILLF